MKNVKLFGLTCFKVNLEITRPQLDIDLKYLLLESDPNPNYYARNDFPPNAEHANNWHLYLLVKNRINCFQDVVLRNKEELKKKSGLSSNNRLFPGSMTFKNDTYQCVRMDITEPEKLPQLIEEFNKLGVKFVKDQKFHAYRSFVYYKRYVDYIKLLEDGIYQDSIDSNRYFIHVGKHLDFEEFEKGLEQIKNKCEFHQFDTFLTDMIYKNEVHDFVGVYSKHCQEERLGELKKEINLTFLK